MGGKFVFVPDEHDEPKRPQIDLLPNAKDMNSVPEAAKEFGVSAQTIRRLIAEGELESIRVGRSVRITKQAMIEFVISQGVTYGL